MTAPGPEVAKTVAVSSGAMVAWFADTLPIVQWLAGVGAIAVAVLTVIKNRREIIAWFRK